MSGKNKKDKKKKKGKSQDSPKPAIQKSVPQEPAQEETNEGTTGFLLTSRDNPDGTPAKMTDDERRRLDAIQYLVQQAAKQNDLTVVSNLASQVLKSVQDDRSKEIAGEANPEMADAAIKVRCRTAELKVKTAKGDQVELKTTNTEIEARADVARSLKAIADVVVSPLKWSGKICIKVGKWLRAKVGVGSDDNDAQSGE